jgi:ubiquinone/menaquinone biosynthesis C-methylase UbiE/ribosomal protein S27AE
MEPDKPKRNTKDSNLSGDMEIVSGFDRFDFDSLWSGRSKVTSVEKLILINFLKKGNTVRVLEIGVGNGRLSGIIQNYAGEYVGTDINISFLRKNRGRATGNKSLFVASNAYHLPFASHSFSTVVMIRTLSFLSKPLPVLQEISRILIPGGHIIISVSPKPSIATLVDDIKSFLNQMNRKGRGATSFSTSEMEQSTQSDYPSFVLSRKYISGILREAGFVEISAISSGLEDYRLLNLFPAGAYFKWGSAFPFLMIWPTITILAEKEGDDKNLAVEFDRNFICPKCGNNLILNQENVRYFCENCGYESGEVTDIIDLRYIPPDAISVR